MTMRSATLASTSSTRITSASCPAGAADRARGLLSDRRLAVGDDHDHPAHPEFTDRFMRAVVDDCLGLLGEDGHAAATDSLDRGRNDGPLFARWMTRFILNHLNGHNSHNRHK